MPRMATVRSEGKLAGDKDGVNDTADLSAKNGAHDAAHIAPDDDADNDVTN